VGPKSSIRTPADEVLHIFRQERPGQVRGVSWLAPVLPVLRDLTDYETALLVKAKIEACLAAVVNDDSDETATGSRVTDANGLPVETFEPGMILYRKGAGEIEIVNPSGGGSHLQFARRALERAAVGAGLTYDQVSGDLSSANYSSLRAGKIEFRALNHQVQWTLLLPQLCVPIAEAFNDAGYVAQLWDRDASRYTHTPPAPEMVDPMKDTMAVIAQVRAGFLTPQRASAMMGYEFSEVVEEYAAALEALDGSGIVLDTDARRVAKSGAAQDAAHIAAVELAATDGALPRQPVEQPAQQ
jgi:lambda family phage portal protein